MSLDQELAGLRQMAAEFKDYLHSDVVFWPLAGSRAHPKLSLGQYGLTRARLSADPRAAAAAAPVEALLSAWTALAERKAGRELPVRVNAWIAYLTERHDHYAAAVAQRAMIALLLERFPALAASEAAGRLAPAEAFLRSAPAGPFVWEAALEPAFPADTFWFLRRTG